MGLPFSGRYERARRLQKEKREQMPFGRDETAPIEEMERGDLPAMLIAALITIVPVALLVLAALAFVGFVFIVR
ncbi:MAG: hypothetical protein Q4G52_05025 [Clostridia bacterium]|nr:hypothetical protein [Clostridia bacterium]